MKENKQETRLERLMRQFEEGAKAEGLNINVELTKTEE